MESELSLGKEQVEERWLRLRARLLEENIKNAFEYFRENRIEPILIKGWAAARAYPEPFRRNYADIDLCVAPELYEKAVELSKTERGKKFNLDLHCGLRHLDTLSWDDLYENSRLVKIDQVDVRILRPEDHLRVLCIHWLTDGGAYREKLRDILYAVEGRSGDFDWDRCLNRVSEIRRGWVVVTIGLAREYYDLEVSDLPFAEETLNIPGWLRKVLEKEWASETRLKSLHMTVDDKKEFWRQIKKRVPPNAIQATIEMEGRFDEGTRFFYQLGDVLIRLKPSIKRLYGVFRDRYILYKGGG